MQETDTIGDLGALQRILAEIGNGSFEGVWRGLHVAIDTNYSEEARSRTGGSNFIGGMGSNFTDGIGSNFMESMPFGSSLLLDQRGEAPGVYFAAAFPTSFMADLLLETRSGSGAVGGDALDSFGWSGTSKDYVEACLRGAFLDWLVATSKKHHLEVRDEVIACGPLPHDPKEAAELVESICCAVADHFATWSMPVPNFDDDEDDD